MSKPTDPPLLECPHCDLPLHPAEPCECAGGRVFDHELLPGEDCICSGTGWVWWETYPAPPVKCGNCGGLSVTDADDGYAYVREPYAHEVARLAT